MDAAMFGASQALPTSVRPTFEALRGRDYTRDPRRHRSRLTTLINWRLETSELGYSSMRTGFAGVCVIDRLRVRAACSLFAAGLAMVDCGGAPAEPVASAAAATSSELRAPALVRSAARDAVAAPDRSADDKAVDP